APAAMRSDTNRNASTGRSNVTLHLDLDDLSNPHEPDRLQDHTGNQHRLTHALVEEWRHELGIDVRQRDRKRRGQRQQHVAGKSPVRGMHADLAQDLETLADDVCEVVEDLGEIAASLAL